MEDTDFYFSAIKLHARTDKMYKIIDDILGDNSFIPEEIIDDVN